MLVLQPRPVLFSTAFTTRIAQSWAGPVPVWLTRAIGACASERIAFSSIHSPPKTHHQLGRHHTTD
jgi:hypothetical protein